MLSIERTKELLNDCSVADKEAEDIRDNFRMLAEIIFEKWQTEREKIKNKGVQSI
ncbi:MAG: putative cytosolic protein [Candidatus Nomurabacteria bacterium GW2011_GWB1_37_5]|uniref:Putative cytosolic protein n=1 Tax=Candidatus Nomurabacteria bacterium GW2011_GWB1_37_5 TaxID=1618742 RepID=A0A0G0JET4_9BACT|nr:MAG: putative cytosolic protein [Candidatus Nomurabacteria bacterium GW2011_GWB1_37_5]